MFFELQLSSAVFTHIVRNRLKTLPLCPAVPPLVDDDGSLTGVKGEQLIVDRIDVGPSTVLQREQGLELINNVPQSHDAASQLVWIFSPTGLTSFTVPFLQVKQEVTIHLVKGGDLVANGVNPTPPFKTLTVYPVFNVALTAARQTQGGGPLTLSYSLGYIDFGILFLLLSPAQRATVQQFAAGIQLPATTLDLSPLTAMLKRPVNAVNAGIVCDPSGTVVVLRVDFDVAASPIAVTRQFFEAAPENLLAGKGWAMLVDKDLLIEDARIRAKKALLAAPKVKLSGGPNVSWDPGGVALAIAAEVELVDACPFFIDDIDMDADVEIRIGFSVPSPNTLRTNFHLTGEPSDLGEEIACALTGALLWPFLGPLLLKEEDLGEGIGAYLGGLAGGPVVTFIGIIAAIETTKLSKDIADKLGDSCKKVDDEHYECNEVLQLIMPLSPGANSQLELERVSGVPRGLVIGGDVSRLREFDTGVLESVRACPFAWQVLGRCTGNGKNNFRLGNQAVITVYARPAAPLCAVDILSDPQREFSFTVNDNQIVIVPAGTPAYRASPYPIQVRVTTTRGVRIITLAPPTVLGQDAARDLEMARTRAAASCYYWEKRFTPTEKIKWRPDPPFDRERYLHFWQIVVRGLRVDHSVRVAGHDGVTILTAQPSRAGVAHMTFLFTPDRAVTELDLELRGATDESEEQRELTVQQVLFEHVATLPFAAPLQALALEGGTRRRLVAVAGGHEARWDLRVPRAPALVSAVTVPRAEAGHAPVVHSGKRLGAAPSRTLLTALDRLSGRYGRPDVIGSPKVGGAGETLYLRGKDGAELFDVSMPDAPRLLHSYGQPAWFEHVAMGGTLLVRFDERTSAIGIYRAAALKGCQ